MRELVLISRYLARSIGSLKVHVYCTEDARPRRRIDIELFNVFSHVRLSELEQPAHRTHARSACPTNELT